MRVPAAEDGDLFFGGVFPSSDGVLIALQWPLVEPVSLKESGPPGCLSLGAAGGQAMPLIQIAV